MGRRPGQSDVDGSLSQPRSRTRIPLRLTRLTPLTLLASLSSDTPQPIVTARLVPGTHDLLIIDSDNRQLGVRRISFARIVRPARRATQFFLGIDTGLTTLEPAQIEWPSISVELHGNEIEFDADELARGYGRAIPGITTNTADEVGYAVTHTWEEASMVLAMRLQRRSATEIQAALDIVRRNRAAFRNNAGIAFSSRPLTIVTKRWLGPRTKSAAIPEQVAARLRGRTFANADEFRRALWIEVADSDLASQFNQRDLHVMRSGFAPFVEDEREHYGGQTRYIIHHRRMIASGGAVFDMSNMLIVTPSRHQDILPPNEHFVSPTRRRRRDSNDQR